MALIIKHSGFGRRRDTEENHRKPCGSGAGKRGHEGRLETTLNAQQQMANKLKSIIKWRLGRASQLQWLLKVYFLSWQEKMKGSNGFENTAIHENRGPHKGKPTGKQTSEE